MSAVPFILFGMMNSIIINSLEAPEKRGNTLGVISMGIFGALLGGLIGVLLFGTSDISLFTSGLLSLTIVEAAVLSFLFLGKPLKRA